jgi:hypothetical protein
MEENDHKKCVKKREMDIERRREREARWDVKVSWEWKEEEDKVSKATGTNKEKIVWILRQNSTTEQACEVLLRADTVACPISFPFYNVRKIKINK